MLGQGKRPQNHLSHLEVLNPGLGAALKGLIGEFAKLRMVHGDPRLDNFILRRRGGGAGGDECEVAAIDLEMAEHEPKHGNYTTDFWSLVYCVSDIVMYKSPGRPFW